MTKEELTALLIATIGVPSLIQVSPLTVKPWTILLNILRWLWSGFCKSLNAPVLNKLAELEKSQKETSDKLDAHIEKDDARDAKRLRERILIFSDELGLGTLHSEEMFNDILGCIDDYEKFCDTHKDFPNSQAVAAIQHIRTCYSKRLISHDFL